MFSWLLPLPPTLQTHARGWVNWCECEHEWFSISVCVLALQQIDDQFMVFPASCSKMTNIGSSLIGT